LTRVLVAGATGLVGRECVHRLCSASGIVLVRALVRRRLVDAPPSPLLEERVVDFAALESRADLFGVDAIVCALGTTLKRAGSREAFRAVDFDLPLGIARLGISRGTRHFVLISALGANPRSRFFYNRVKGELEEALGALGYPSLSILRPSILLGDREEFRLGERIGTLLMRLVPGQAAPIHARDVAAVAVRQVLEPPTGRVVIGSREMRAMARASRSSAR
jgi:uncharacterized protein YbjT (DUF2867 family)